MTHRQRAVCLAFPLVAALVAAHVGAAPPAGAVAPAPVAPVAPPQPAPTIPNAIKLSGALAPNDLQTIQKFITDQVQAIGGKDPAAQKVGRDALGAEVRGEQITAQYKDAYTRMLADAMLGANGPLAQGDLRAKINAAIAVARVAESAATLRLEPVIQKLLAEKGPGADAVVLWGMKAVRPMVLNAIKLVGGGGNPQLMNIPLLGSVAQTVAAHPTGPIAQEAYDTLILPDEMVKPFAGVNAAKLIPELLRVLEVRAGQFKNGMPDDPEVDLVAVRFLTRDAVWNPLLSPALQQQAGQVFLSLLAGVRAQAAGGQNLELLTRVGRGIGLALNVLSRVTGADKLEKATVNVTHLPTIATARDLTAAIDQIGPALKTVKGLENIKLAVVPPPAP